MPFIGDLTEAEIDALMQEHFQMHSPTFKDVQKLLDKKYDEMTYEMPRYKLSPLVAYEITSDIDPPFHRDVEALRGSTRSAIGHIFTHRF